jgi:hypothetical protein
MSITKDIKEIISIQNYCKDIIQELYKYPRPYDTYLDKNQKKIKKAIELGILEYDSFDDELSLSIDTEGYYRNLLGESEDTNIGIIGEKIKKIDTLLKSYTMRVKANEGKTKEVESIYKLLSQIPYIFRANLKILTSNSIFAFKNEPNFDIKMANLKSCREEIGELSLALNHVDRFLQEENNFFNYIDNKKIRFAIRRIKENSIKLDRSFATLHGEIINFINQTIKDGDFIKKIRKLKKIKDNNSLDLDTNIKELVNRELLIINRIKEKKNLPDDRVHDYIDTIEDILKSRDSKISNQKEMKTIEYDITKSDTTLKVLYDYPKINSSFLAQELDLISFLKKSDIQELKLLGVFVRLLKNYSSFYDFDGYIRVEDREFLKIYSKNRKIEC